MFEVTTDIADHT